MRYCCEFMRQQLNYDCSEHGPDCPDVIIKLDSSSLNKGKLTLLGRNAEYECNFCPSCGTQWAPAADWERTPAGSLSSDVWRKDYGDGWRGVVVDDPDDIFHCVWELTYQGEVVERKRGDSVQDARETCDREAKTAEFPE